jgi:hypothetical protein
MNRDGTLRSQGVPGSLGDEKSQTAQHYQQVTVKNIEVSTRCKFRVASLSETASQFTNR